MPGSWPGHLRTPGTWAPILAREPIVADPPRRVSRRSVHDRRIVDRGAVTRRARGPNTARSDPHERRSLGDRGLEVAAHAHRAASPDRARVASSRKRREVRARIAQLGRDGHQSLRRQSPSARERLDEARGVGGPQPPFWASPRHVHLHEHPRARRVPRDDLADLEPVDRLPQRHRARDRLRSCCVADAR